MRRRAGYLFYGCVFFFSLSLSGEVSVLLEERKSGEKSTGNVLRARTAVTFGIRSVRASLERPWNVPGTSLEGPGIVPRKYGSDPRLAVKRRFSTV